jgi:hypothetical protein
MYCNAIDTVSCGYAVTRNTSCETMSSPKTPIGRYRGFPLTFISPSTTCFPIHSRNKAAAPASITKMDHGSTAPKASGPNRSSPKMPYSKTVSTRAERSRRSMAVMRAAMRAVLMRVNSSGSRNYCRFGARRKSSTQSLPRIGLPSGSRRTCNTSSLVSAPVVNSAVADFQNPDSLSSSLSYKTAWV